MLSDLAKAVNQRMRRGADYCPVLACKLTVAVAQIEARLDSAEAVCDWMNNSEWAEGHPILSKRLDKWRQAREADEAKSREER